MALRNLVSRKALVSSLGFRHQLRGLQTFTLPDLPYDYGALEPAINGDIMQLHHQKHHQTYVTNYNKALEQLDEAINKGDAPTVVKLQSAIKFNGGGLFEFHFYQFICVLADLVLFASNVGSLIALFASPFCFHLIVQIVWHFRELNSLL